MIKSYFYGNQKMKDFLLDQLHDKLQETTTANICIKLNNFDNVYANCRGLYKKDNKGRFRKLDHMSKSKALRGLKYEGSQYKYKTLMKVYQAVCDRNFVYQSENIWD